MSQSNNSSDRAASLVPDSDTIPGGAWLLPAFRECNVKRHLSSKRSRTAVSTAYSDQLQSFLYHWRDNFARGVSQTVSSWMFQVSWFTTRVSRWKFLVSAQPETLNMKSETIVPGLHASRDAIHASPLDGCGATLAWILYARVSPSTSPSPECRGGRPAGVRGECRSEH